MRGRPTRSDWPAYLQHCPDSRLRADPVKRAAYDDQLNRCTAEPRQQQRGAPSGRPISQRGVVRGVTVVVHGQSGPVPRPRCGGGPPARGPVVRRRRRSNCSRPHYIASPLTTPHSNVWHGTVKLCTRCVPVQPTARIIMGVYACIFCIYMILYIYDIYVYLLHISITITP